MRATAFGERGREARRSLCLGFVLLLTLGGWEQPWDHGRVEELPPETFAAGS